MSILTKMKQSSGISVDIWVMLMVLWFTQDYFMPVIVQDGGITGTLAPMWAILVVFCAEVVAVSLLAWLANRCGWLKGYRYLVFKHECTIKHKKVCNLYLLFASIPTIFVLLVCNLLPLFAVVVLCAILGIRLEYDEPRSEA